MLKHLLGSVREYKKYNILTPVFCILEVILEVVMPFLMAKIIDSGIYKGDLNYIFKMGAITASCAIVALVFGVLAGRFAAIASGGFAKNLRHDIYYKVQTFSFANIDKFSTSGLVTRLTTDITNIQNAYMMIIRIAVRAPAMLIFSMVMSFSINSRLAVVFVCVVPILAVVFYVIATKAHPVFERVFNTYDKLNLVVQENLRGIRVVKSFVREDNEVKKFKEVSGHIYKDFTRAERILAFNMPSMQFAMYTCAIIISWFGARMVIGGTMAVGELTSLFTYSILCLISLMLLSQVFVMIIISRASVERIAEVFNEESTLQNVSDPVMEVPDGSIVFKNVNFSYADDMNKLCLMDIDLEIKSGETIGIIGGTGSAKSTLVQLIPRLYDVTGGELLVGGNNVKDYDMEALRNQVAVVLQKNVLFSGTIKENLRWGDKDATDEELVRVARLAQADSFIQEFPDGYDTYIEQGGSNVSGGQRQRLCIARALLKKPKIIILDDSTSAVDTKTDALIQQAFQEEIPDTTQVIIAQRISSIEKATKIVVMDEGGINAIGTHDELIAANEIYQEVYNSQKKGGDDNGRQ